MPFLPPNQQCQSTAGCAMETVSGLKEPKATYPQGCSSGRTGQRTLAGDRLTQVQVVSVNMEKDHVSF